jgi:hypothetical protein
VFDACTEAFDGREHALGIIGGDERAMERGMALGERGEEDGAVGD